MTDHGIKSKNVWLNLRKFIEKKNWETFNFHCHQHLVDQVENTGSLGVNNCFPFEGWFFNTKCIPAGTRNHFGQVVAKVNFKVKLHFQTDDISIKDNLRKLIKIPSYRDEALKLRGKVTKASFANLTTNEQNLLKRHFNNAEHLNLEYSFGCTIGSTSTF